MVFAGFFFTSFLLSLGFPIFFLLSKALTYQPGNCTGLERSFTGHQEQSCCEPLEALNYNVDRLSSAFPNGK